MPCCIDMLDHLCCKFKKECLVEVLDSFQHICADAIFYGLELVLLSHIYPSIFDLRNHKVVTRLDLVNCTCNKLINVFFFFLML